MKTYLPILFVCFLLSGCAQAQIVDRMKIIQSVGFDMHGDTIRGSHLYSAYEKKARLLLLTTEAQTIYGLLAPLTTQSDRPVASGQLRTFVISEKFARRGISELASALVLDPLVGSHSTVIITKQNASDILSEALKYPPFYLANLIKQNMENGNTPSTDIHIFLNQYFGEGQDVYLPILHKDPKGVLQMDGLGVFKEDKLKLTLTNKEGLYVKLLKDKTNIILGTYEFKSKQKDKISLKIIYGNRKITVQNEKAVLSLKLNIEMRDYPTSIKTSDKNQILELKKQIENNLTTEITNMLENFQKNNVDPIGLGDLNRSKQRNWNEQEFMNLIYPNMKFEVHIEIKILQLGVGH
ncbi:germination protein, Ger(x)C family [Paenibacillus sp. yr247]|uniref:Ger(x)C family spore germination protein n=1 Tax=Paenibacillus sp. yr247 TaxID=1761880 RepID=UPI00088586C0|nr:Ger(x)C family spore germination protein [Paenibacillus sp. yr247]SDN43247.1 germination protein, Ger(x)C family [Paenibacillus sp. yr247]